MSRLRTLLRDCSGAGAAEFALSLPLLLLFLFGIIDTGRFMWSYNQAEKATQMGVRYAVATDLVARGLDTYSFVTAGGVTAGDRIPNDASAGTGWFASATCNNASCTCRGSNGICGLITRDRIAFDNIVARMRAIYGPIAAGNVEIEYRNVGLGYAGDPNGSDVSPLVTIRLTNLSFQPLTFMLFFQDGLTMPDFRAALTLEDGSGTGSN